MRTKNENPKQEAIAMQMSLASTEPNEIMTTVTSASWAEEQYFSDPGIGEFSITFTQKDHFCRDGFCVPVLKLKNIWQLGGH